MGYITCYKSSEREAGCWTWKRDGDLDYGIEFVPVWNYCSPQNSATFGCNSSEVCGTLRCKSDSCICVPVKKKKYE